MSEVQNVIVGFTGKKGTGKSTLMACILRQSPRLAVWDPLGEHAFCPNPIYSADRLKKFFDWSSGRESFACRFIPEHDLEDEFDEFCFEVYRRGALTVGIEEIPLVASAGAMPDEFGRLVRLGRHRRVNLLYSGQRFSELPRTLTALSDKFALFGVSEPRDLDLLAERTSPEIADQVAGLGLHEGILYDVRDRSALRITSRGEPARAGYPSGQNLYDKHHDTCA